MTSLRSTGWTACPAASPGNDEPSREENFDVLIMTAPRRVFAALDEGDGENHHFPIRQGYPAVKTVKRTAVEAGCIFFCWGLKWIGGTFSGPCPVLSGPLV